MLADSLSPSFAHLAPTLPRAGFQYSWPSPSFRPVPVTKSTPHSALQLQPAAYESNPRTAAQYQQVLRERKANKKAVIDTVKQLINSRHNKVLTAELDQQAYSECVEAVKLARQLYSPLLSAKDYYTLSVATALCLHDRLLARLLEEAHIAGVALPSELFARMLQLLTPLDSNPAVRCVAVVVQEYFTQYCVGRGKADSNSAQIGEGGWRLLRLSAEQYGRILLAVSRTSSIPLLLPLLDAFRHGSNRPREVPLTCTTLLPALRYLWQQRQHETLLSLTSAVLQWEVVDEASVLWSGSQLSAVCELLELHFGSLRDASAVSEFPRLLPSGVPDSWLSHLPPQTELHPFVDHPHQLRTSSLDQHVACR